MAIFYIDFDNLVATTNGEGLWSSAQRAVTIHRIELELEEGDEDPSAEFYIAALFTRNQWNPDKHGLVYTDPQWLREFKARLGEAGFSDKALRGLNYTEQGMQGDDYVSLSANAQFAAEFMASRECRGRRGASKVSAEFGRRIAALKSGEPLALNHRARPQKSKIAAAVLDAFAGVGTSGTDMNQYENKILFAKSPRGKWHEAYLSGIPGDRVPGVYRLDVYGSLEGFELWTGTMKDGRFLPKKRVEGVQPTYS